MGLDAVVITEHQIQWNLYEIKELQREFPEIKVYAGLEVTLQEGIDLVIITKNTGVEIPFLISFDSLLRENYFPWERSFVFVAHLFRWLRELHPSVREILSLIHGIEMNSINILLAGYLFEEDFLSVKSRYWFLYEEVLREYNLIPLFNSDAHQLESVGSVANEIEVEEIPGDEEELARLLKNSYPSQYQDIGILKALLLD